MLAAKKMSEAEVSLRLAFFLIKEDLSISDISVAIDGAQVKLGEKIHFPIIDFLSSNGWIKRKEKNIWRGKYFHSLWEKCIIIHSSPGQGDVVADLKTGHKLRVESKKGPLSRSKSSQEFPLIREALGQLLTIKEVSDGDILAIAVPSSEKFEELIRRWRNAPLIKKLGIRMLTVDRQNNIKGFQ